MAAVEHVPWERANTAASGRTRSLGTISSSRCQTTRDTQCGPWTGLSRDANSFLTDEQLRLADRMETGGARRNRTDDLLLAKQALSQLSYGPAGTAPKKREDWWAWEDLNFRPHAYQARALTN